MHSLYITLLIKYELFHKKCALLCEVKDCNYFMEQIIL